MNREDVLRATVRLKAMGRQRAADLRAFPPRRLSAREVREMVGTHVRLARFRLRYSISEVSQATGISEHDLIIFKIGKGDEIPIEISVLVGFLLRDDLEPLGIDTELLKGSGS